MKVEDYALIGDTRTAGLVGKNGSLDWLCVPRFDHGACFAALLGTTENGHWLLSPTDTRSRATRRYLGETLILETQYVNSEGRVRVLDFMPFGEYPAVARIVEGLSGTVSMQCELVARFDYGKTTPWVRKVNGRWTAIAGPDGLALETPIALNGVGMKSVARFDVSASQRVPFQLRWFPSHEPPGALPDVEQVLRATEQFWTNWVERGHDRDPYREHIVRSLITLKALTYSPTGGMVAAPTTSLPEALAGKRNWDYRYCWLRDSTFTFYALLHGGYQDEARAFRDWMLRAVAGDPGKLQICYGLSGERRLPELELGWLSGYENSRPVHLGNLASDQMQLDVYGEVGDTLHQARRHGIDSDDLGWPFQLAHTDWLEQAWREPDQGLWEKRGDPEHFTHSKVLAWVAFDRAIKAVERWGLSGPVDRWQKVRSEIRESVLAHGFDSRKNSFIRAYGSDRLDASLLLIPAVGFLAATDARVLGTIAAVERELMHGGLVRRYLASEEENANGIEGAFVACSFWLVDAYVLSGQRNKARSLFERLLTLQNDVGLLSEEYDVTRARMVGNFPQSLSHVALVNSARNLGDRLRPSEHRQGS